MSEYQCFVRDHCQWVKSKNPGLKQGAVMEILGRMYREMKAEREAVKLKGSENEKVSLKAVEAKVDVDAMVKELEIITLDD